MIATQSISLASIKRRITTGTILDAVGHHSPAASGRRTITKAGATGFWWTNDRCPKSWTLWPRAKDVRIDGPDTFTLMFEDGREMTTLTIVTDASTPAPVVLKIRNPTTTFYPPVTSDKPHELARHKVQYGHSPYIVYRDATGQGFVARATAENIGNAIAAIGDGKMSLYTDHHHGQQGNADQARIWQSNAAIGYL